MTDKNSLAALLISPSAHRYFGAGFPLKIAVLACLIDGGNLSDVARAHNVTRQAASKHACRARKVYGMTTEG